MDQHHLTRESILDLGLFIEFGVPLDHGLGELGDFCRLVSVERLDGVSLGFGLAELILKFPNLLGVLGSRFLGVGRPTV